MSIIVKYWNNLLDFGQLESHSQHDKRNIRLMNVMSFVIGIVLVSFSFFGPITFKMNGILPIALGGATLTFTYYILITRAPLYVVKVYFTILPVFFVSLIAIIGVGRGGMDKYYLIVCAIIPLLLFKRQKTYMALFAFIFIVFIVTHILQETIDPFFPLYEGDLRFYSIFNFSATFFFVFLFIKMFKNDIFNYQVKVEQQKSALEVKQAEIVDSIKYAQRIQEAIMPSLESMYSAIGDGFVLYLPKDIVAGDFFWMEQLEGVTYFAAADCTGHGVPGAMVSVICSNALNKALLEEGIREPGKLLDKTREIVIERLAKSGEEVKDGMDISLCAWSSNTNIVQWSGANNPIWILRKGAQELEETKANKQPIGLYHKEEPFTTHEIELKKGDSIYIFTDGYQDQFGGPKGKKFKAMQLKELIIHNQLLSMDDQMKLLHDKFMDWKGSIEQIDDVCIIGVRV